MPHVLESHLSWRAGPWQGNWVRCVTTDVTITQQRWLLCLHWCWCWKSQIQCEQQRVGGTYRKMCYSTGSPTEGQTCSELQAFRVSYYRHERSGNNERALVEPSLSGQSRLCSTAVICQYISGREYLKIQISRNKQKHQAELRKVWHSY